MGAGCTCGKAVVVYIGAGEIGNGGTACTRALIGHNCPEVLRGDGGGVDVVRVDTEFGEDGSEIFGRGAEGASESASEGAELGRFDISDEVSNGAVDVSR